MKRWRPSDLAPATPAKPQPLRVWAAVALLVVAAGLYTWGTWNYFTRRYNGGNDFYSRYVAWRAFVFEGRNPYSEDVTREIQIAITGRLARPGEDENALIYPWYALLLQWPFIFLPWPWARAIYMVLCQGFIVAGLMLTARLYRWRLAPGLLAVTAGWAVLFYPEARGIILGQLVITQYLLGALALWLISRKHDVWAGVCLALSTVRPPAVYLFVPFVLFYALFRRRWQLVAVFFAVMAGLGLGGFLILPTWLTDWLYRMGRYPDYTIGQSPIWLLTHQVTNLGTVFEVALSAACLAGLGWCWWLAVRAPDDRAFHWTLGMTLVVSNLVVPRSATTNYIFLLFPTYLLFAALDRRWPRAGQWLIVGLEGVSLVGLWWLFAATVHVDVEHPIMFIPSLVALGLALIFFRRWLVNDNRQQQITV